MKITSNIEDKETEKNVPDHVLFGLKLGTITGPLSVFPKKKALVSLKKERNKTKNNKFLSAFNNSNKKINEK